MVSVVTAPNPLQEYAQVKVFLAGTIEEGKSLDWQQETIKYIQDNHGAVDIAVFNPRREMWSSLDQENLEEQITWELKNLHNADIVFLSFLEDSKSPVSMLEFGMLCEKINNDSGQILIVVCPEKFYRYDNIRTTINFYKDKNPSNHIYLFNKRVQGYFKLSETISNLT